MKNLLIKKCLVVETSLDLMYILPYFFYLVHVIYYFDLTKITLSIYFYSISKPSLWQRKKHFSVVICVCCMSCSEIFLCQDGNFQHSMGCTKKSFLLPNMVATFAKYQMNFPILRKRQQFNFLANALKNSL